MGIDTSFESRAVRAVCFALLGGLTSACGQPPTAEAPAPAKAVTIMTFNVENLFDNADDLGKIDETFLALDDKLSESHKAECSKIPVEVWRDQCLNWDWSDEILERKLSVVAAAILQVDDGRGPDILALQEVENMAILDRLRTDYLEAGGYGSPILIEGHDARGIDVAFLSRLELAGPATLHRTPFEGIEEARIADTRGILEATFVLPDGSLLTGYSVHFPAPFLPTLMREMAYDHLNRLKSALPAGRLAFAAGDFNTTAAEDREQSILDHYVRPHWNVVHEQCQACRGTTFYARTGEWSFLDMILWSPGQRGENATWSIRANSVEIANGLPEQVLNDGTPARFRLPEGTGVSDHWPIVVTIESK